MVTFFESFFFAFITMLSNCSSKSLVNSFGCSDNINLTSSKPGTFVAVDSETGICLHLHICQLFSYSFNYFLIIDSKSNVIK